MLGLKEESGAQLYDRFQHKSAISMLMLATVYLSDAIRSFVMSDIADVMKMGQLVLAILLVINLLPVVVKLKWYKFKRKPGCVDPDGFVASSFKEAAVKGFTIGFIASIIGREMARNGWVDWPAATFFNIILALMLGVLSISFLMATREDADDEDEFGDLENEA